jgi:mitotic spindle assembly checkpoint protein MAD1
LTGQESTNRPPSRDTFRNSTRIPSTEPHREKTSALEDEEDNDKRRQEVDALKAEVKKLTYTIENHKQEDELAKLRHESELREARRKAEEDFKKMQAAEGEKARATRQYESLQREMTEARDAATNEKAALERRLREMEDGKRAAEEEIEDVRTEGEESLRSWNLETRLYSELLKNYSRTLTDERRYCNRPSNNSQTRTQHTVY